MFDPIFKIHAVTEPSPFHSRIYYDGLKYFLDSGAEFIPMDQRSVNRHLKREGMSRDEIEDAICEIQLERFVAYAGALAGHGRGLHESGGAKLLATSSPKIIQPSPVPWPTLKATIEAVIGHDPDVGERQVEVFHGWLKFARESLVSGKRRPGQALALAGPPGCGKSLLIDLVELILGGRRANPYPAFSGRTQFNGDLAGAELLAVDDEAGSRDIRARQHLAAAIKANLFSGAVRIENKHRTGFMFRPCWRLVIALNHEPESLLVLPPLTDDIEDKITVMHCHKRALPMPTHTLEEKDAFFKTLRDEMPGLIHALDAWVVPDYLKEERCGIAHFHHPAIKRELGELSPEGQLLALVDSLMAKGQLVRPWEGTAADLKSALLTTPETSRDADKLLGSWPASTGVYLGRLEGGRVVKLALRDGIQRWRIDQPQVE